MISFLYATFMKIGENDSTHEPARMLQPAAVQASSKFKFFLLGWGEQN